jgi:hypothetical protein
VIFEPLGAVAGVFGQISKMFNHVRAPRIVGLSLIR